MNIQELTTWTRLLALDLDAAEAALPFSARLARVNGWPQALANRAIEEYRKFCFLAVHAGHPVTPSDEVDQVWHLHLLCSRHYADALCRDALGVPLHHGPTKGGAAEGRKYRSWYEETLASYRRYFGEPPGDVWPVADERFHDDDDFVRVNRRRVVVLDRALLRHGTLAAFAGGGLLAVASALAQAGDASRGPGIAFGLLVAVALPIALIIAVVLGARRRRAHPRKRSASDGAAAVGGTAGGGSSANCADGSPGADCGPGGGAGGCGAASGCGGGCGGGG